MAILLSRLGRFAYRRAVPVLIAWVVIAAGAVIGGLALGGTMQDSFKIPGTESQQAIDRLAAVFPQTAGASAQVVVHSTGDPVDDGAIAAQIEEVTAETLAAVQEAGDALASDTVQVEYGGQVFQQFSMGITVIEVIGVLFAGL